MSVRRRRAPRPAATERRDRGQRVVTHRARVLESPAPAFRSRRGAIIAWLVIVVTVFGASALHTLMHHSRGV